VRPHHHHTLTHRETFDRTTTRLSLLHRHLSLCSTAPFSLSARPIQPTPPLTTRTKALSISFSLLFLSLSSRERGIIFSKSIIFLGFRFLGNFDLGNFDLFESDEIRVEF
jgi:hypothetical protein